MSLREFRCVGVEDMDDRAAAKVVVSRAQKREIRSQLRREKQRFSSRNRGLTLLLHSFVPPIFYWGLLAFVHPSDDGDDFKVLDSILSFPSPIERLL